MRCAEIHPARASRLSFKRLASAGESACLRANSSAGVQGKLSTYIKISVKLNGIHSLYLPVGLSRCHAERRSRRAHGRRGNDFKKWRWFAPGRRSPVLYRVFGRPLRCALPRRGDHHRQDPRVFRMGFKGSIKLRHVVTGIVVRMKDAIADLVHPFQSF